MSPSRIFALNHRFERTNVCVLSFHEHVGTFSEAEGLKNKGECTICTPGYQCPNEGMTEPEPCGLGYFSVTRRMMMMMMMMMMMILRLLSSRRQRPSSLPVLWSVNLDYPAVMRNLGLCDGGSASFRRDHHHPRVLHSCTPLVGKSFDDSLGPRTLSESPIHDLSLLCFCCRWVGLETGLGWFGLLVYFK